MLSDIHLHKILMSVLLKNTDNYNKSLQTFCNLISVTEYIVATMAIATVPEKAKYGGHNYEFCDKVPEELICNICTKPLLKPHLIVCCGQHYCESCLKFWFNKHKKCCPHCRADGEEFQHVPNKSIERKVNELKIHCANHKNGCQWVGELSSSQSHLNSDKGCEYVEVSCTNMCGEKMKRKYLNEHTHSHCLLRQYECKYCGHKDTYHAITACRVWLKWSLLST